MVKATRAGIAPIAAARPISEGTTLLHVVRKIRDAARARRSSCGSCSRAAPTSTCARRVGILPAL